MKESFDNALALNETVGRFVRDRCSLTLGGLATILCEPAL